MPGAWVSLPLGDVERVEVSRHGVDSTGANVFQRDRLMVRLENVNGEAVVASLSRDACRALVEKVVGEML